MAAPFFSGALARTARAAVFAIPADVAGQPLGEQGVDLHQPDRHVDARSPDALHAFEPRPELVPRDCVGSAELRSNCSFWMGAKRKTHITFKLGKCLRVSSFP